MLEQGPVNLMALTELLPAPPDFRAGEGTQTRPNLYVGREWVQPELGEGYSEVTWLSPDLFVFIADTMMHDGLIETMDGDGWAAFHLRVRGRSTDRIGRATQVAREPGTFATVIYPQGVERSETHQARERYTSVAVAFRPAAMHALALAETPHLSGDVREFVAGKPMKFSYQFAPMSAAMSTLARDVTACELTGRLRQLYIESKAMELVCLALQTLAEPSDRARAMVRISVTDKERLRAVRAHLDAASGDTPSLASLGRKFGLNRNKLVYGFNALFGQGVFEYWRQRRLSYARALLLDSSLPITEIALRAGYESPSSFTRAFVTQFGHSPRCARRSLHGSKIGTARID